MMLLLVLQFFTRKPLACDTSSLPKYPPSKEFDSKRREEEARRSVPLADIDLMCCHILLIFTPCFCII